MEHIGFVPENGMCTGCGACTGVCPTGAISSVWDEYGDRVPKVDEDKCIECSLCVLVCPGHNVDYAKQAERCSFTTMKKLESGIQSTDKCSVLYAKDENFLSTSTSGGLARELAASLIEEGKVDGALMIVSENHVKLPLYAKYKVFTDPEEIRSQDKHSMYCPAPLLEGLRDIDDDDKTYVIVTLPCHTHALRKLQSEMLRWQKKIKYIIGLLCGGTPTAKASMFLFEENGIDYHDIDWIDYRYKGAREGVYGRDSSGELRNVRIFGGLNDNSRKKQMTGAIFMSPYFYRRRCLFCADYFNAYADVSCGDPWIKSFWKDSLKKGDNWGTLTITRNQEIDDFLKKLQSNGILETRLELTTEQVTESMSPFQRKKIKLFNSYRKYTGLFNMIFPEHVGLKNPHRNYSSFRAFINLLKNKFALNQELWWTFKYIQFLEEAAALIKRKLRINSPD